MLLAERKIQIRNKSTEEFFLFFLPGEIKNVLANSSVAFSRISLVILKIRPINGGTR